MYSQIDLEKIVKNMKYLKIINFYNFVKLILIDKSK